MRSHLGRPINLKLPSNRRAILLAGGFGVAVLAWRVSQGVDLLSAAGAGFNGTVAVILGWAIGRELDPDEPNSAALAAMLTMAGWVLLGRSGLAATAAALLALRVVVRTTGRPPLPVDYVVLLGVGILAGRGVPGWVAAMGLAYALARDVRLPNGARARQLLVAGGVAGVATISVVVAGASADATYEMKMIATLAAAAVGFLAAEPYDPLSHGDIGSEPLLRARLVSGRRIGIATGLLGAAVAGTAGVGALVPLFAAFPALALERLRHGPA